MRRLDIRVIVGARPQFIKAASIFRAIDGWTNDRVMIDRSLIHTGQHYDDWMSGSFFRELEMPAPANNLRVGSAPHGVQTGKMMALLEPLLVQDPPDVLVVVGDTNSTLAGALTAAKLHIPVAHVEAGLRSHNRRMPEEINRVIVDHISTALFCSSRHAVANLSTEGIHDGVHLTGDVMYEALNWLRLDEPAREAVLKRHGLTSGSYGVATVHRAENTDDPTRMSNVLGALGYIGSNALPIVLPAHPRLMRSLNGMDIPTGIRLIEPVGHREMIALAQSARLGLTDSGGLQKELYWLGTPCITMRDETEWVETVQTGWNVVTGADPKAIRHAAEAYLDHAPGDRPPIYGHGDAGPKIVGHLVDAFARPGGCNDS